MAQHTSLHCNEGEGSEPALQLARSQRAINLMAVNAGSTFSTCTFFLKETNFLVIQNLVDTAFFREFGVFIRSAGLILLSMIPFPPTDTPAFPSVSSSAIVR